MRALQRAIGPRDLPRGHAGDLALALHDLRKSGPVASAIFVRIGRISSGTFVVGLRRGRGAGVVGAIHSGPEGFSCSVLGEVFGIYDWARRQQPWLGWRVRGVAENRPAGQIIKHSEVPRLLTLPDVGHCEGVLLAQLRTPPRTIRRVELSVAMSIIGGPGIWAPINLFHHLREALGLPIWPSTQFACRRNVHVRDDKDRLSVFIGMATQRR
eukprot:3591608-Pyramimonas_sp.AAC.1